MTSQSRKIVIIIGGGIAGLCAAVYARKCGYEVELLEQHDSPGGLATSWRRGDYTFETCLYWLLGSSPDGTLHAQWQEVCDIDSLSFVYAEEYLRLEDEHGGCLSIYTDVDRLERELLNAAPGDETEIRHLAGAIRQLGHLPMPGLDESWSQKGAGPGAHHASVMRFSGNWKGSMEGWLMTPETASSPCRQFYRGCRISCEPVSGCKPAAAYRPV